MKLKIAIAGPSGVGKSTLAQYIADKHQIPFITTSTKPLWDRHGINDHQQLIGMTTTNPSWGLAFQREVLDYRVNQLYGKDEFVTDRSPVDNMVYFLLQNSHMLSERETKFYLDACIMAMNLFNGYIYIPFTNEIILENDGKRVVNSFYQMTVSSTFDLVHRLMKTSLYEKHNTILDGWDFERRKLTVDDLIKTIIQK